MAFTTADTERQINNLNNGTTNKRQNMLSKMLTMIGFPRYASVYDAGADMARLKELHRTVMDPTRISSISAVLAELETIGTRMPADATEAWGELHYIRGVLSFRAGRANESLASGIEALRIDITCPFLSEKERSLFNYNLASQAEDVGKWDVAIDAYRRVIPSFEADPKRAEDQRLGTRERLAFCLHKAGKYAEAFALNEEVLAKAEKLFGPDSEKLLVVVTSLVQNAYKLNQPDVARTFLERRLSIATKHMNIGHMDASFFQLGMLCAEQGRTEEAETFVQRRLQLARRSGDIDRIEDAEEDLELLRAGIGC